MRIWQKVLGNNPASIPALPAPYLAFSQRKILSYGGDLFTLRRSSDNATQAFAPDVNGDAPLASIASWLGVSSAYVTQWNDQSGNGWHASQGTSTQQPGWTTSGPGTRPCLAGTAGAAGDDGKLANAAVAMSFSAFTSSHVVKWSAATGLVCNMFYGEDALQVDQLAVWNNEPTSLVCADYVDGTGQWLQFATNSGTFPLSTWVIVQCRMSGDVAEFWVNGVACGGSYVSQMAISPMSVADFYFQIVRGDPGLGPSSEVQQAEGLIYNTALSDSDLNAALQNQAAYYGISL